MVRLRPSVAVGLCAILGVAAGYGATTDPNDESVASVQVSGGDAAVVGGTLQLSAQAKDGSGGTVSGTFTWSSSSATVATVDGDGLVSGVGRGSATITATETGSSVTGEATVTVGVASVAVTSGPITLNSIAATATVTAEGRDVDGAAVAGVTFAFTSSDEAVATVSAAGVVEAVANGTATISASADGKNGSATVTVSQTPVGAAIDPAAASVAIGGTVQFTGGAVDANGFVVASEPAVWSSDDIAVATVNGSGLATGEGVGSTNIIVTAFGFADTAVVTVIPPTFAAHVQPIFTARCALSGCHAGAAPQQGMNLSAGQAYANIVNVASMELPAMMRVRPSLPDSSYLVHKIQGTQVGVGGSGDRMPLGGPFLSAAQIDLIRQWILAGANNN